jgi:hypothetical protein
MEAVSFVALGWMDWLNNRWLLKPIDNIPPVEVEERYYAMMAAAAAGARLKQNSRRQSRGGLMPVSAAFPCRREIWREVD